MITFHKFASDDILGAIKDLFVQLSVPFNYFSDKPFKATDVLKLTLKDSPSFHLIKEIRIQCIAVICISDDNLKFYRLN